MDTKKRINEPCIVDVLVKDKYASISWSVENGTDEIKIDLNDNEKGTLQFEFGDTSKIGYGGTDNWGKDLLPIYVGYEKNSQEGDSVYVNNITIQELAGDGGWCKCERLANGAVMYTALSENPFNEPRIAYFKHKTTDEVLAGGFYKGRKALKEWYVTVIQKGNPNVIGYGGTDNWGKDVYPINLGYKEGSEEGDSVFVENITIQEFAGEDNWCKCSKLQNGALLYQALTENTSKNPRTAYFIHKTTDKELKKGYYAGRPAAPQWYVTVIQEGNPNTEQEINQDSDDEIKIYDFDELIDKFNKIILENNKKVIIKNSSTYLYLRKMFDTAVNEFNNNSHNLFNSNIFNEVYQYRGNNNKFENNGTSLNILCSWILAMALSEILPTSGSITNIQTQFFKFAYDLCGGRNIPLYDGYTLKSDPMILRYVAGAIYAIVRSKYSFEYIDNLRGELGGSYIPASIWSELQYSSSDFKSIKYLGYIVNSDLIIPSAPGPYTNDCNSNNRPKPWNEGQDKSQFYFGDFENDWYNGNYKVDVEIDKYVTENYNMGSDTFDSNKGYGMWETYDKNKKLTILHAVTMPWATDHYFFGSRRVKFNGVSYNDTYKFWRYNFVSTNENVTDNNDVFEISGPFAQFENKLFTPNYGVTSTLEFIDNIMELADNSRYPTYHTEYGRRRPLGGVTPGTCRGGEINGHPLNGILNGTLGALFADSEARYNKYMNCDDFPHDGPRTYPSGHAAMTWTMAMVLGQMDPDNIVNYMTEAYKVGVGRTIARFHWNSDTLYGRLFATFILPIINAMNGKDFQTQFNNCKKILMNPNKVGDWNVKLYIKNLTGKTIYSTGEIRLYIGDHYTGINIYLPNAKPGAGALYTFNVGENNFSNKEIHCEINGGIIDDTYDREQLDSEARLYDQRHYNSTDCGWKVTLDVSDPRCNTILNKAGATYVLKIENL